MTTYAFTSFDPAPSLYAQMCAPGFNAMNPEMLAAQTGITAVLADGPGMPVSSGGSAYPLVSIGTRIVVLKDGELVAIDPNV